MVARRHDDAVVVGELLVGWVVGEEDVAGAGDEGCPHGRPEVVGFEAEEEVEDVAVEGGVERVVRGVVVLAGPPAG